MSVDKNSLPDYVFTKKSDCRRSLFPTSVGDFLAFSKLMFAKLPKI